eukprot:TRINITY_DN2088_c0_g1_i2.p1 TRINITY_DN2088_c0_g1~~TRINITY_DN2088_c0_g1_i2.p1  ORF type:complete len:204 (-),score=28.89 TRINITY_DN2088_c0_g1_i2:1652-2188(-)
MRTTLAVGVATSLLLTQGAAWTTLVTGGLTSAGSTSGIRMAAGGQQQTRRAVLGGAALLASQLAIGHPTASDAATAPKRPPVARLPEEFDTPQLKGLSGDENPNLPQFRALPSGVRITDIQVGNGAEVKEGSTVSLQWVLRRSNGYFVDSSEAHNYDPFIYRCSACCVQCVSAALYFQ